MTTLSVMVTESCAMTVLSPVESAGSPTLEILAGTTDIGIGRQPTRNDRSKRRSRSAGREAQLPANFAVLPLISELEARGSSNRSRRAVFRVNVSDDGPQRLCPQQAHQPARN